MSFGDAPENSGSVSKMADPFAVSQLSTNHYTLVACVSVAPM